MNNEWGQFFAILGVAAVAQIGGVARIAHVSDTVTPLIQRVEHIAAGDDGILDVGEKKTLLQELCVRSKYDDTAAFNLNPRAFTTYSVRLYAGRNFAGYVSTQTLRDYIARHTLEERK